MDNLFLDELRRHGAVISRWYCDEIRAVSWNDIIPDKESAKHTAVFITDVINDFCKPDGALYDPRIGTIVDPIIELLKEAYKRGVPNLISVQEGHLEDAKEFDQFPRHGVWGTRGAEMVDEIKNLPFANEFVMFRKNAIAPMFAVRQLNGIGIFPLFGETIERFLSNHSNIRTAIVVGDCTDLCAREMPMYLKYWANQFQRDLRVIVPVNCVATFHLPQDTEKAIGAKLHPAEVMHRFALYQMSQNGIDIVKKIL